MADLFYEDFGGSSSEAGPAAASPGIDPLDGYEQGYKAGWDDSLAHQETDIARIGTEIAATLQDMRHRYEEARADVLTSFRPVLEDIVGTLLPSLANAALGPTIVAEVADLLDGSEPAKCEIRVCPETLASIKDVLNDHLPGAASLTADPKLEPGQVDIRFGEEHRQIDLGAVATGIAATVTGFLADARAADIHPSREVRHG